MVAKERLLTGRSNRSGSVNSARSDGSAKTQRSKNLPTLASATSFVDTHLDFYKGELCEQARWVSKGRDRMYDLAMTRYGGLKPFFAALDTNSDSLVDFDEFARGIKTLQVEHLFPRSLQRRVFAYIDTNSDGTIELSEMQEFLASAANSHSSEELDLASAAAAASNTTVAIAAAAAAAAATATTAVPTDAAQASSEHQVQQQQHSHTAAATAAATDRAQMLRAKAALVYALNRTVPNAAANPLFDNKTAFLRKQFGVLHPDADGKQLTLAGLRSALGPAVFNKELTDEQTAALHTELCTTGATALATAEAERNKRPPALHSPITASTVTTATTAA
eukprot:9390-Heterococcus_DN1.PRE.3